MGKKSSSKALKNPVEKPISLPSFFVCDIKSLSIQDCNTHAPFPYKKISDLINPVHYNWKEIKGILENKSPLPFEWEGILKTGEKAVTVTAGPFSSSRYVIFYIHLQNQHEHFLQNYDDIHYTLNTIQDAIIEIDKNKNILFQNNSAEVLLNLIGFFDFKDDFYLYTDEEKKKRSFQRIIDSSIKSKNEVKTEDFFTIDKNGNHVYLDILVRPLFSHKKSIKGYVIIIRNLTGTHIISEKLKWLANHDSLTGIMNRRAFENELNRTIEKAKQKKSSNFMLYLDLDQFKLINDICGHSAGDELLKSLTSRISISLEGDCILARLGGDEFGIILENTTLDSAGRIAEKILNTIKSHEFIWGKKKYEVGVSIGMVPIYENSISISHIMSMADIACFTAKDLGRNRIHLFVGGEMEYMARHSEMQWVSNIKSAIETNSFLLYTQDIVPSNPEKKLRMHKEVLIRMKGENGKIYYPADFLGAAEKYNIIKEIDQWVITNTFRALSSKKLKSEGIVYSINLSGSTINDSSMTFFIADAMKKYKIPPKLICFEITENIAIANFSYAREFIRELKMVGFEFALDDFGSGLSSFNYLKNLPIDILKIDGHFVKNIHKDPVDFAMVKTIFNIGKTLKISTVAEYVENHEILTKIQEIGIEYAQGYEISKPKLFA